MNTALNIAIAEATNRAGRAVARKLASGNNRLLLLGNPVEKAEALRQELIGTGARAEIVSIDCARDACWEADVVVITLDPSHFAEVAARIRPVVTGKDIICISCDEEAAAQLRQLLPHAHVVTLHPDHWQGMDQNQELAEMDETALEEVKKLCSSIEL